MGDSMINWLIDHIHNLDTFSGLLGGFIGGAAARAYVHFRKSGREE